MVTAEIYLWTAIIYILLHNHYVTILYSYSYSFYYKLPFDLFALLTYLPTLVAPRDLV